MSKIIDSLIIKQNKTFLDGNIDINITSTHLSITVSCWENYLNKSEKIAYTIIDSILYLCPHVRGFQIRYNTGKRMTLSLSKNKLPIGYFKYLDQKEEDGIIYTRFIEILNPNEHKSR